MVGNRFGLLVGGIALGSCLASNPDWGDETGEQSASTGSMSATSNTSTAPSSATTASTTDDPSTTTPSTSTSAGETDSTTALGTGTGLGDQYAATVISDAPVGYWRLGDAVTPVAADENGMNDGTYLANVMLGQPSLTVGDDFSVDFPACTSTVSSSGLASTRSRWPSTRTT